ncbi:Amicyanin precursor protein [Bradyrhizobium sp. ORS 285]|uniref:cupredoxin domain-containing protein n=1 Tax=Bradyrhizobium sp. ORS 285 TaxID=115808 RepID=UPI00024094CC|nr:cupredoxin domain-containing protein [Bradyrhizobium sp. ORS 285]CCD86339.1 Amicyanin precursor protein [Bradyrhizobium sp. ORS 285]SMX55497.1 Amicyanin precursor protein [Bradyrhizobium sp. ORS 285]
MRSGRIAFMSLLALVAVSVPARAATIRITIDKLAFSPASVSAKVGDTVEWVNKDALAHTATARNGDFDVTLPPSRTVSSVLKKAGTVEYYCRFHPNMKAALAIAP